MALVSFTDLDGAAVAAEAENVTKLEAIPAALLPVGIASGTRISLSGGVGAATLLGGSGAETPYLDVQGTVANTIALLSGGGGSGLPRVAAFGLVASGGGIVPGIGFGLAAAVHNGPGDYTVTLNDVPSAAGFGSADDADGGPGSVSTDGPVAGNAQNVKAFDGAGLAADRTFLFVFFDV